MASEAGTATGMEDLLTRLITFVTTDTGLTSQSPSQAWSVLRQRRDNLLNVTSDFASLNSASQDRRELRHLMRQDCRTLNTDSETNSAGYFLSSSSGTHITMELRTSREPVTLELRASTSVDYMIRDFRVQYSDDGTNWTTVLTVTGETTWSALERRSFAIPASGSHVHWRLLVDEINNFTTGVYISGIQLIESNGTVANHYGSEVIFNSPGLAGTDNIYTGIRTEYDASAGWYNFFMAGFQGYLAEESFLKQPGIMNPFGSISFFDTPMVPLWDDPMLYWFRASGRSVTFFAKVSSSYEAGYLGFHNAYSAPSQYPYPLIVGGSLIPNRSQRGAEWRYSSNLQVHSAFFGPATNSDPATDNQPATLYQLDAAGVWRTYGNRRSQSQSSSVNGISGIIRGVTNPTYSMSGSVRTVWPHSHNDKQTSGYLPYREALGGGYVPLPIVLVQRLPVEEVFGELEGIVNISGFGNSSEDTTTIDGDQYVLFANTFRSEAWEYCALRMD